MRSIRHGLVTLATAALVLAPLAPAHADESGTTATTVIDTPATDPPAPPSDEAAEAPTETPVETPAETPAEEPTEQPSDDPVPAPEDVKEPEQADDTPAEEESPPAPPAQDAEGASQAPKSPAVSAPAKKSAAQIAGPDMQIAEAPCGFDACDDAYETPEGTLLTVDAPGVFANDEGSSFAFLYSLPQHGLLVQTLNGGFTYLPAPGYSGTDTFTYSYFKPPFSFSRTATVTITIPDAPQQVAHDDVYYVKAGTTLSVSGPGVFANDDSALHLAFIPKSFPTQGDLTQFSTLFGGFKYTPDPGFTGTDQFTYQYAHAPTLSLSTIATVKIIVYEDPVLAPDSYVTDMDTTLTIDAAGGLLANDTGGPIDDITPTGVDAGASLAINTDGSFGYTPAPGFYGTENFNYTVTYGGGQVSTPTYVTIIVNDTRVPMIVDDEYTVGEGKTLDVPAPGPLANDTFPSGTTWTLTGCTTPEDATVTCGPDGHLVIVPGESFSGDLSLEYTVEKVVSPPPVFRTTRVTALAIAATPTSATGTITVHVTAAAVAPPVAADPGVADNPVEDAAIVEATPVDDSDAALPDTGSPVSGIGVLAALLSILAGVALLRRRRTV